MKAAARIMIVSLVGAIAPLALGATREVGPGKQFADIASAVAAADAGDVVLVYPLEGGKAYARQAVLVRKPNLTIRAAAAGGAHVKIDGAGFNYSGRGPIPRAIFQFDPQAHGCRLEGFELSGAHNESNNGAGVRINQANGVTVAGCEIHDNDMGIMSNGNGTPATAAGQRIESCVIRRNGTAADPGYNHNLYLGGTSVTVSGCEIAESLTGNNLKSRAHLTRVEFCYLHDSANRELDLVDAKGDTTAEGSDAVVVGCVIVKARHCEGNRAVIHFGTDGGAEHDGTIHLVHNTIVTPYVTAVVDLSAPKARASLINNIVWDGGGLLGPPANHQTLLNIKRGEPAGRFSGQNNWLSAGFAGPAAAMLKDTTIVAPGGAAPAPKDTTASAAPGGAGAAGAVRNPPFANPAAGDYHLTASAAGIADAGLEWSKITLPAVPAAPGTAPVIPGAAAGEAADPNGLGHQYKHPAATEPRPQAGKPDLGAYEYRKN